MKRISRTLRIVPLAACLAAAAGCVTPGTVRVDFVSDPPGAMIFSGTQRIGVAPISIHIERPAEFADGGCTTKAAPLTATWVSGAEAAIESKLCPAQGAHQVFTFRRPIATGAQADADYAVKLKADALYRDRAAGPAGEGIDSITGTLTGWPPALKPRP